MAASSAPAASLLKRQLKEMQAGKDLPGISCGLVNDDNIFEWEVMLMISDDCKYYGGTTMPLTQHSLTPHGLRREANLLSDCRRKLPCPSIIPTELPAYASLSYLPGPNPLSP